MRIKLNNSNGVRTHLRHGRRDYGGSFVAWVLLVLGVGTFAPCVLFPAWQSCRDLQLAQRVELSRVEALQQRVELDQRELSALRNDPSVIARLARRDLGIHRSDDQWVRVDVPVESRPSEAFFAPRANVASIIAQEVPLEGMDAMFAAVFRNTSNRRILLAMSVMLMGAAFWIPGRRL